VHGTGAANTDFRSPVLKKKVRPVLHEAKYKYHEVMLDSLPQSTKFATTPTSPMLTTMEFYTATGRKLHSAQQVARFRTSHLDGFRTFTGGDNEPFISHAHTRGQSFSSGPSSLADIAKSRYYSTKELEHKKATHETQLVSTVAGMTLEGEVNLDKVADIRRTLRRRYHARSQIRGIFNCWDLSSQGFIRPEDVHVMMNRLGIPVNMDEAKVLVASACKSKAGVLMLDEFIQLICNEDDKFNVDLATLEPNADYHSGVTELSANLHHTKIQNTLKMLLQERYAHIAALLYKADNKKCGLLSKDVFCETIFKLGFPPHISSPTHILALYKEFGGDDKGISFKSFCEKLKTLKVGETLSPRVEEIANPVVTEFIEKYGPAKAKPNEKSKLLVLDPRTQPHSKLMQIHSKGNVLKRHLMKKYENADKLTEALSSLAAENSQISQEALTEFVKPMLKDNYSNQLDSFLSTFVYNSEGNTNIQKFVQYVFADELESAVKLEEKYRAPPLAKKQPRPMSPEVLQKLLEKIEKNILQVRSTQGANLMAMFDRDKDGYVTAVDMRQALNRFDIRCTTEEAQGLIDFLDGGVKGYLSMNDLAKSLQIDILQTNADKLSLNTSFNISQPSTEFLQSQLLQTQNVNQFYMKTRAELVPKLGTIFSSSRYGANPPYKSTFPNVQADPETTHYLSEDSRLTRKSLDPINLGPEDKARYYRSQTAKDDRKRRVLRSVEASIASKVADEDLRVVSKLYSRAMMKEKYQSKLEC